MLSPHRVGNNHAIKGKSPCGKGRLKYESGGLNLTVRNLSKISLRNNEVNNGYNF
jgi:hypothetical protein